MPATVSFKLGSAKLSSAELSFADPNLKLTVAGIPVHYSMTPGKVDAPGPALGAHNKDVFEQFGIT